MPNLQLLALRLLYLPREPIVLAGTGFSRLESFCLDCHRGDMRVPGWVKQHMAIVSSLDIRLYKLADDDLEFLPTMPNLHPEATGCGLAAQASAAARRSRWPGQWRASAGGCVARSWWLRGERSVQNCTARAAAAIEGRGWHAARGVVGGRKLGARFQAFSHGRGCMREGAGRQANGREGEQELERRSGRASASWGASPSGRMEVGRSARQRQGEGGRARNRKG